MKRIDELEISKAPWKMPSCCLSEGFVWGGDGYCVCHISGKPSETYKAMNEIAKKQDPSIGYVPPSAWHDYANPSKAKANARMIAAAPELYEALKMLLELCESFGCDKNCRDCGCAESEIMFKAKYALAKASGEEVEA